MWSVMDRNQMNKRQWQTRQRIRKGADYLLAFVFSRHYELSFALRHHRRRVAGHRQRQFDRVWAAISLRALRGAVVVRVGLPGGWFGRSAFSINNKRVSRKVDWIKWLIWLPWLSLIVMMVVRAGGYREVNLLHLTDSGISVDEPFRSTSSTTSWWRFSSPCRSSSGGGRDATRSAGWRRL